MHQSNGSVWIKLMVEHGQDNLSNQIECTKDGSEYGLHRMKHGGNVPMGTVGDCSVDKTIILSYGCTH